VALVAVGIFAVWGVAGGVEAIFDRMPAEMVVPQETFDGRWFTMVVLAGAAVLCLPRQFHVTVVENTDERHLLTASWLFPLYMFLISLFVLPIAIAGLAWLPEGSNPDLFVIALPLAFDQQELALLAFIGGFSSATSMVIVASIALSIMVSNHVVAPLALNRMLSERAASGDMRDLLLTSRRVTIAALLGLGFLYLTVSDGGAGLAAMGLTAFVGVAQVLPAMMGGIMWRGATRAGALAGLVAGAVLWLYTLFLPALGGVLPENWMAAGPFGIAALRPQALFGLAGLDPLVHATVWSLGTNILLFVTVSMATSMSALERLQAALFVDVFRTSAGDGPRFVRREAAAEDLFILAQRILGAVPAQRLFDRMARAQGRGSGLPEADDAMVERLERELAGSVGGASAHAMVMRATGGEIVSLTDLIDIADETQKLMETTQRLADKTTELERTADELRRANQRLRRLDRQKDDFLSQVSHELRTPMTSIRSFSEILLSEPQVETEERARFTAIIHAESIRLTRLLDEILDISRLESGYADIPIEQVPIAGVLSTAMDCVAGFAFERGVRMTIDDAVPEVAAAANPDRLLQILINLLSNGIKYNGHAEPRITLHARTEAGRVEIDVADNGGGVTAEEAEDIFAKFTRGTRAALDRGAGLGLPISRAMAERMGGTLAVVFREDGTSFFRVTVPLAPPSPARAAE
ncbi:MAG: ATP-binding protein, partial [Pseudomonadota bacterium]